MIIHLDEFIEAIDIKESSWYRKVNYSWWYDTFNQYDYKHLLKSSSQQYRIDKVFISFRKLHRFILIGSFVI